MGTACNSRSRRNRAFSSEIRTEWHCLHRQEDHVHDADCTKLCKPHLGAQVASRHVSSRPVACVLSLSHSSGNGPTATGYCMSRCIERFLINSTTQSISIVPSSLPSPLPFLPRLSLPPSLELRSRHRRISSLDMAPTIGSGAVLAT